MTEGRTMARTTGVLFLISTAAYLTGSGWIARWFDGPELLAKLSAHRAQVLAGSFLELVNAAAVVAISILLFRTLKRHNEAIALGYFGSRVVEAILLAVGIVASLALFAASEAHLAAGSPEDAAFQAVRALAVAIRETSFQLAMVSLGAGSLAFCYLLYRTRLVPRVLSVLGIVGYIALLASGCLSIAGFEPGAFLFVPGGIFEVLFPLWLIVKGFPQGRE